MTRKCLPCIGANLRRILLSGIKGPVIAMILDEVPECDDPDDIQFCAKKRGKSQYQVFVQECMLKHKGEGDAPQIMRTCAAEWKKKKGGL